MMISSHLIPLVGLATAAFAETIDVKVGSGGLQFDPNSITAQIGDTVRFHFYSGYGSHSVALSAFDTPCQPAENGFYSGIISGNTEGDHTFTINITSTSPQWYYCSVGSHCQSGMVGVINPPAASPSNDGQDITAYASAAQGVLRQTPPGSVQGGVVSTSSSGDSPASTSSSSSESGGGLTPASPRPSLTATTTTSSGGSESGSAMSTTGESSAGPVSTISSSAGSSSKASTTTPPTGSGTVSGSTETATTTTSGGRRSEWSVVLWLSVILGGLVFLMA